MISSITPHEPKIEITDALLKDAVRSKGQEERSQVLIIIAARFQRLSWKYESMAYNVMLKNMGVLYQTMYLVATSMDIQHRLTAGLMPLGH